MRQTTSLWLLAVSGALAGCSGNSGGPMSEPALAGQSELRPGTTYAGSADGKTTSPIKHVIVIIGENRSFDHIFATYKPNKDETVDNLLSKGIVNEDGTPGPNFNRALQYTGC